MLGRIFLLDHDQGNAVKIENSLRISGFNVIRTTFETFVDDSVKACPDLMLICLECKAAGDIATLCGKIKAHKHLSEIPIIFASYQSDLEKFTHYCNATAYIHMPIDMVDLTNTIKDVLSI